MWVPPHPPFFFLLFLTKLGLGRRCHSSESVSSFENVTMVGICHPVIGFDDIPPDYMRWYSRQGRVKTGRWSEWFFSLKGEHMPTVHKFVLNAGASAFAAAFECAAAEWLHILILPSKDWVSILGLANSAKRYSRCLTWLIKVRTLSFPFISGRQYCYF